MQVFNSTYYCSSDIINVLRELFTTLRLLAPDGAVGMSHDYFYYSDVLKYKVPTRVVVGYSNTSIQCYGGEDTDLARETMFVSLPLKKYVYENELQMLGMMGLYPGLRELLSLVAMRSLSFAQARRNVLWSEATGAKEGKMSVPDAVVEMTFARCPDLELRINKKANPADLQACREQRAQLAHAAASLRVRLQERRVNRAEFVLEHAKQSLTSANRSLAKAQERIAKWNECRWENDFQSVTIFPHDLL